MREALRTAIAAGTKTLGEKDTPGQTCYLSGVFLFAPLGLSTLDEAADSRNPP
jgi:hypothetical protein